MSSNVNIKLRKKAYDSSDDSGDGIVVFNTTDNNIYVGGQKYGETKLSGLSDTTITSVADGQALVYDSNSSKWVNSDIDVDLAESITYSNLVSLISANSGAGNLEPGKLYRITDYVTTTVQTDTQSANHPFDLIVLATSHNTLDCQAKAVLHAGDTYFSNADLSKWQVWYDINNDTNKYDWADSTNGKGVIYRLIDELGNDCPYDFKNIQFKRKLTDGAYDPTSGTDTWVYTFNAWNIDDSLIEDASVITNSIVISDSTNACYNNIIEVYRLFYTGNISAISLNDIVFLNTYYSIEYYSYFGCYSNTFGNSCQSNTFGNGCYSNTFVGRCSYNTFGNDCQSNTFGDNCESNTFGNRCEHNTFGDNCEYNTFGNRCESNTFGDNCQSNTFGNRCESNTFGDNCGSNTFGDNCETNTFGNGCYSNTFGNFCESNTFGNRCNNIIFGNSSNPSVGGTYCRYNVIENGNQYIRLYQTTNEGYSNYLQNIYIAQGVNNSATEYVISTIARNLSYRTTVAMNKAGTDRIIYCEDEITDMLPSITGNAGEVLTVNSGATGVEWTTIIPGSTTLSGLTDTTVSSPSNGQILTYDTSTSKWINANIPTEIPSQTGNSGKFLTTNGSAVSWDNVPSELPTITGNANKILAVNSGATGVEWITNSGGGSSTLAGLTDTAISSVTNGQVLKYNTTSSKWENSDETKIVVRTWTVS